MKILRLVVSLALLALAFVVVGSSLEWSAVAEAFHSVEASVLFFATASLGVGVLLSSWRFQLVARDLGYRLTFIQSVATLSTSQLAGAIFFQLAGQLIARGAMLARLNIPVSATIVMTGYERLSAVIVSMVLAGAGALYLFGGITLSYTEGGAALIKTAIGLSLAIFSGAMFAWGHLLQRLLAEITLPAFFKFARNVGVSVLIQVATMTSYFVLARALAPGVQSLDLVAAATLVMFAASIPISFAGWGVREMSAIFALGAIGIAKPQALVAALLVGVLSLIVVCLFSLTALLVKKAAAEDDTVQTGPQSPYDYLAAIAYILPLAVATGIFFQVFVPTERGLINVNLADPIALIAGGLFLILRVRSGAQPWRMSGFEWHIAAATLAMLSAFLHGYAAFGWSQWAFANKLMGWFVLLAYGASGALIVWKFGKTGFSLLLKTFAAVAVAIVCFEVMGISLLHAGFTALRVVVDYPMEGFSQNRNAFAFILLMTGSVLLATRWPNKGLLFAIVTAGIWYSGSRTAFLALPAIVAAAIYFRLCSPFFLVKSLAHAGTIVVLTTAVPALFNSDPSLQLSGLFSSAASNVERLRSLEGGLRMFGDHIIFGAGLGAFYEQEVRRGTALIIHSTPIWLLAETGLIGFAVFVAPIVRIFFTELRRDYWDDAAALLVVIIVAFTVFSNAHEILYQRAFWLLLGAACAVRYAADEEARADMRGRPLW